MYEAKTKQKRCRNDRLTFAGILAAHLKDEAHVVCGASAAQPLVEAVELAARRRDKVVVLTRPKFKPARLRRERAKGDGEVHELMRFITDSNYSGVFVGDAT